MEGGGAIYASDCKISTSPSIKVIYLSTDCQFHSIPVYLNIHKTYASTLILKQLHSHSHNVCVDNMNQLHIHFLSLRTVNILTPSESGINTVSALPKALPYQGKLQVFINRKLRTEIF